MDLFRRSHLVSKYVPLNETTLRLTHETKNNAKRYFLQTSPLLSDSRLGIPAKTLVETRSFGLTHPAIATVEDVTMVDSTLLVITTFYSDTLEQWMAYPEPHVERVIVDILQGLEFLHRNDIVHRRLHARNIFIEREPRLTALLGDFYRPREPVTPLTPEHMSGWTGHAPSSDMWCLGLLVHELVFRRPAFPGGTLKDIFKRIGTPSREWRLKYTGNADCATPPQLNTPFEVNPALPGILVGNTRLRAIKFIESTLCLDPDQRMTASEALQLFSVVSIPGHITYTTAHRQKPVQSIRNRALYHIENKVVPVRIMRHALYLFEHATPVTSKKYYDELLCACYLIAYKLDGVPDAMDNVYGITCTSNPNTVQIITTLERRVCAILGFRLLFPKDTERDPKHKHLVKRSKRNRNPVDRLKPVA